MGDRRLGESWTIWQSFKNGAIYVAVRAALLLVRLLPARWLPVLGAQAGRAAFALARGARQTALSNLSAAFPGEDALARARRNFYALGRIAGEMLAQVLGKRLENALSGGVEPGSLTLLQSLLGSGQGVVLVSAHLGNWESVARALREAGLPLSALGREPYDARLRFVFDRLRQGVPMIYRGDRGAAVAMVRVLKRGHVLGIPMDLAARVPSKPVSFLGRPAETPVGPARLALRTGARLVVATLAPGGHITATEIAYDRAVTEDTLLLRINDELGRRICALWEMWIWAHPRWRRSLTPARYPNNAK